MVGVAAAVPPTAPVRADTHEGRPVRRPDRHRTGGERGLIACFVPSDRRDGSRMMIVGNGAATGRAYALRALSAQKTNTGTWASASPRSSKYASLRFLTKVTSIAFDRASAAFMALFRIVSGLLEVA